MYQKPKSFHIDKKHQFNNNYGVAKLKKIIIKEVYSLSYVKEQTIKNIEKDV